MKTQSFSHLPRSSAGAIVPGPSPERQNKLTAALIRARQAHLATLPGAAPREGKTGRGASLADALVRARQR